MSNTRNKPILITILGPTASGKTELGISLAKEFGGEIVSADSRQIYKGMDIGTAKPTLHKNVKTLKHTTKDKAEFNIPVFDIESISHYMFDVARPDEEFTVSHFKQLAEVCIDRIYANNHIPFLVGGTGFYISAIVDNLSIPEAKPDLQFRQNQELRIKNNEVTIRQLYQELLDKDPDASKFVESHNPRRIIRALEVIRTTGKKLSELRVKGEPKYNVLRIGLKVEKEELENRINARVDNMVKAGLVNEVRELIEKYPPNLPAMSGIGYREIIDYLNEKTSLEEAVSLIKLHTRQFARRQMKWFKRDRTIWWIENSSHATRLTREFMKRF